MTALIHNPPVLFVTGVIGVAAGLAWTETGGELLYVEALLLPEGEGLRRLDARPRPVRPRRLPAQRSDRWRGERNPLVAGDGARCGGGFGLVRLARRHDPLRQGGYWRGSLVIRNRKHAIQAPDSLAGPAACRRRRR